MYIDFLRKFFTGSKILKDLVRPGIAMKIFLGYLAMTMLIAAISVFTLLSLNRLNRINESVIHEDAQASEIASRMTDNLFAEELYVRRYFILRSPDILDLFRERSAEFSDMVDAVRLLSGTCVTCGPPRFASRRIHSSGFSDDLIGF